MPRGLTVDRSQPRPPPWQKIAVAIDHAVAGVRASGRRWTASTDVVEASTQQSAPVVDGVVPVGGRRHRACDRRGGRVRTVGICALDARVPYITDSLHRNATHADVAFNCDSNTGVLKYVVAGAVIGTEIGSGIDEYVDTAPVPSNRANSHHQAPILQIDDEVSVLRERNTGECPDARADRDRGAGGIRQLSPCHVELCADTAESTAESAHLHVSYGGVRQSRLKAWRLGRDADSVVTPTKNARCAMLCCDPATMNQPSWLHRRVSRVGVRRAGATWVTGFLDFACDPSNRRGAGCGQKFCSYRRNKAGSVVVGRMAAIAGTRR